MYRLNSIDRSRLTGTQQLALSLRGERKRFGSYQLDETAVILARSRFAIDLFSGHRNWRSFRYEIHFPISGNPKFSQCTRRDSESSMRSRVGSPTKTVKDRPVELITIRARRVRLLQPVPFEPALFRLLPCLHTSSKEFTFRPHIFVRLARSRKFWMIHEGIHPAKQRTGHLKPVFTSLPGTLIAAFIREYQERFRAGGSSFDENQDK